MYLRVRLSDQMLECFSRDLPAPASVAFLPSSVTSRKIQLPMGLTPYTADEKVRYWAPVGKPMVRCHLRALFMWHSIDLCSIPSF